MLGKEEFLCITQNKITAKKLGVILMVRSVREKKKTALAMFIGNQASIDNFNKITSLMTNPQACPYH